MCMSKITKEETQKKRLPVWGVVCITINNQEVAPFAKTPLTKGLNIAIKVHSESLMMIGSNCNPVYDPMFHKFLVKEDAEAFRSFHGWMQWTNTAIRRFFFPKGEKVVYGIDAQSGLPVVACKKMINPRTPKG